MVIYLDVRKNMFEHKFELQTLTYKKKKKWCLPMYIQYCYTILLLFNIIFSVRNRFDISFSLKFSTFYLEMFRHNCL